jgi:hypothetical protein
MDYLKKRKAGDERRWTEIKPNFFLRSSPFSSGCLFFSRPSCRRRMRGTHLEGAAEDPLRDGIQVSHGLPQKEKSRR